MDQRQVGSVWDVLNVQNPDQAPPPAPPPLDEYLAQAVEPVGYIPGNPPHNEMTNAFKDAWEQMQAHSAEKALAKFPELAGNF